MKLYSYLNFDGNCRAAFDFYSQHLGGKITMMLTHEQAPNPDQVPPDWKNAILHARMNIGETELLAADIPNAQPMRSIYLTVMVDSIDEAERIYAALSADGEIFMGRFKPGKICGSDSVLITVGVPGGRRCLSQFASSAHPR
jgi:PhnB protein